MWYATRRKGCEKTEECDKTEHSCWQLRRQEWTKILFSSYLNNFSAVGSWELLTWGNTVITEILLQCCRNMKSANEFLNHLTGDPAQSLLLRKLETKILCSTLSFSVKTHYTTQDSGSDWGFLGKHVTARGKQTGDLLSTEYDLCYEIMNWNYKIHDMLET